MKFRVGDPFTFFETTTEMAAAGGRESSPKRPREDDDRPELAREDDDRPVSALTNDELDREIDRLRTEKHERGLVLERARAELERVSVRFATMLTERIDRTRRANAEERERLAKEPASLGPRLVLKDAPTRPIFLKKTERLEITRGLVTTTTYVEDPTISRTAHAEIQWDEKFGQWTLTTHKDGVPSSVSWEEEENGGPFRTTVNVRKGTVQPLANGNVIIIGGSKFVFRA